MQSAVIRFFFIITYSNNLIDKECQLHPFHLHFLYGFSSINSHMFVTYINYFIIKNIMLWTIKWQSIIYFNSF